MGVVKGEPRRFVKGHHGRLSKMSPEARKRLSEARKGEGNPNWSGDTSRDATHAALNRNFPKTGRCEDCGERKRTDYAFLRHPLPYTRLREDYQELCRKCHMRYDFDNGHRKGHTPPRKTHCVHGHELTLENTYTARSGRSCRICRREAQKRRWLYMSKDGDLVEPPAKEALDGRTDH